MLRRLAQIGGFKQRRAPCLSRWLGFRYANRLRTQTYGHWAARAWRGTRRYRHKERATAEIYLQEVVPADNAAGKKICFSYELCDEPAARVAINLGRCSNLKQLAGIQNCYPVCDRERFLLIVRYIDGRQIELTANALDFPAHFQAQFRVEV